MGVSRAREHGQGQVAEHRYGDHPSQVCELHLPPSPGSGRTAVLVHGGFWRAGYDLSLERAVAADLVGRGWAVWNVDYRGTGDGGGWRTTLQDLADAVDALAGPAAEHGLDLSRTAFVGHSAGGHLVTWAATRGSLPGGAPGAVAAGRSAVLPAAVVAQAGVVDLTQAEQQRLGDGAALALLGAPSSAEPEPWALADPVRRVPLGVPLLAVTGAEDDVVPPSLSQALVAAALAAGDDAELVVVPGEGHGEHLEPASGVWREALAWLDRKLPA